MQEAFRENHGLQCGFCTPGMIMAALDIVPAQGNDLDEQHHPRAARRQYLPLHRLPQHRQSDCGRREGHGQGVAHVRPPNSVNNFEGGDRHERDRASARRCAAKKTSASLPARANTPTTLSAPGETRAAFVTLAACPREDQERRCHRRQPTMPGVVAVLTGADLATDKIGNLICGWMIHSKDGTPMKMAPHPAIAAEQGLPCRRSRSRS